MITIVHSLSDSFGSGVCVVGVAWLVWGFLRALLFVLLGPERVEGRAGRVEVRTACVIPAHPAPSAVSIQAGRGR